MLKHRNSLQKKTYALSSYDLSCVALTSGPRGRGWVRRRGRPGPAGSCLKFVCAYLGLSRVAVTIVATASVQLLQSHLGFSTTRILTPMFHTNRCEKDACLDVCAYIYIYIYICRWARNEHEQHLRCESVYNGRLEQVSDRSESDSESLKSASEAK